MGFYSEELHEQLKHMELVTVGVVLGLGYITGSFQVLEEVYSALEPRSNFKGSLLLEKISNKVEASKKLKYYETEIRKRSKPRFKDIKEAYEKFIKFGDSSVMQDTKSFIEKVIISVNELLEPLKGPKFITELQEGINKLQACPYDMNDTIQEIRQRIKNGENFYQKVKSIESSELRKQFSDLRREYREINVKLNYFEEQLVAFEREQYFISNMESIVKEEAGNLRRVLRIGKRVEVFRFHRASYVNMVLYNLQIDTIRAKFADWQLREGIDNMKSKTVEKFLEIEGVLPRLVKRNLKLAKRLRSKFTEEKEWKSWPFSNLVPSEEYTKLESNYKYFKRFLSKKDRPKKPAHLK